MLQEYINIDLPEYTLNGKWLRPAQQQEDTTLIFLHDSLGCITLWRDFPERIATAAGLNTLIYDRRGYGQSAPMPDTQRPVDYLEQEAVTLLAVMDQTGIDKAILWGFSDGGSIALQAAAKFPGRISGIIVQGAHVIVEDITLEGIATAARAYREADLRARLMKYHGSNTDRLFAAWTDTWLLEQFRHWTMVKALAAIYCPVMVLQGSSDEYGTEEQVSLIAAHVSGYCETHLLQGAGHAAHKDVPEQAAALSLAFLRDHIFS